jgi:hypothetical protein
MLKNVTSMSSAWIERTYNKSTQSLKRSTVGLELLTLQQETATLSTTVHYSILH